MPRHSREQPGFTLIGAALVVTILGSLIAFAVPAYQDYLIQRDVNAGLLLVNGLQGTIESYHRRTGTWPTAASLSDTVSPPMTNSYVRSIVVRENGVIELEFNDKGVTPPLRMKTLEITPYANARGNVLWQCGGPWTLSAVLCGERLQLDMKM
jgi:Tfp pilus assembly major pilin PilA